MSIKGSFSHGRVKVLVVLVINIGRPVILKYRSQKVSYDLIKALLSLYDLIQSVTKLLLSNRSIIKLLLVTRSL